jgi:transposase
MLTGERFHMLRDLFDDGLSISEIARQTGHDRKTIRKYLNSEIPPMRKKKSRNPGKIDPYKEYIISRLNENPLSASRIYREIQEKGFTGKYGIVKIFVREVRPKVEVPAVYRFETKPGIQAQADWAKCGHVEIDGKIRKLYCFTMTLGYSRVRFAEFTLHMDVFTLIQCHLNAFQYFGGYPQEILYDNMKQIVLDRKPVSSDSTWNSKFEDFFRHFGFIPRLCRPYRPQTKGKIESVVKFVKRDFFMGGNFSSFSDINSQLQQWLFRVNSISQGTTHEIPFERLKQEGLQQMDSVLPYNINREESRKISRDSFLSYLGNQYSVPYKFAGRTARLQIHDKTFSVFVGLELVCTHEIEPGHGKVSRNKDHFKGLLSEILKQNSASSAKSQSVIRFNEPDVEHRPLSAYDVFSAGDQE